MTFPLGQANDLQRLASAVGRRSPGGMGALRIFAWMGWVALLGLTNAQEPSGTTDVADELAAKLAQARSLHLTDSTRSRELSEEALALARSRQDRRNEAVALIELAIALRRQNQNGTALQHARDALAIAETLPDRPLLRRAYKEVGHTYWALSDSPHATDFFQRALRLCEEDGDINGQSDNHAGLGAVAAHLGDIERSRTEKELALKLAEQGGDINRIGNYAANLGNAHLAQKNFPEARRLYERALGIAEELQQRTEAADIRALIARVDTAEGKLDVAEQTLRDILPSRRRLRGRVKLTDTLTQLASVVRRRGKHDEALTLLNEAAGYAAQLTSRSLRINVLDELATAHEAKGNLSEAIAALRKKQEEVTAQAGEAAQTRAAELREAFAAERRELEIARLRQIEQTHRAEVRAKEAELRARQAELERARTARATMFGGFGAGIVALAGFALLLRGRLKAERRIHARTREARDAAEEADRFKTRFLGIASHDIRAPLGNIVNLTAHLRREQPGAEVFAERCDLIGLEAQRVMSLVEDLLTTAAMETRKLQLRIAPLDLAEVVRAVIESLSWQTAAKRQTVEFPDPSPRAGAMEGDTARLQQVVANLLSNAIKFSPPGSTIQVGLTQRDRRVVLTIRDQGAGLDADDLSKLFVPFERLATHPTAGESSHGLGLSIAQELVQRHGGAIRVESQPGQGSTFVVDLPVSPAA